MTRHQLMADIVFGPHNSQFSHRRSNWRRSISLVACQQGTCDKCCGSEQYSSRTRTVQAKFRSLLVIYSIRLIALVILEASPSMFIGGKIPISRSLNDCWTPIPCLQRPRKYWWSSNPSLKIIFLNIYRTVRIPNQYTFLNYAAVYLPCFPQAV